jgi:hypothetical protein
MPQPITYTISRIVNGKPREFVFLVNAIGADFSYSCAQCEFQTSTTPHFPDPPGDIMRDMVVHCNLHL